MSRKSPIPYVLIGALALVLLALAIGLGGNSATSQDSSRPEPRVSAEGGGFRESPGQTGAVFAAGPLKPGESARGRVRLRNSGDAAGLFTLSRSALSDRPGPNGGRLSERLQLEVLDVSDSSRPAVVYTGGVGPLDTRPLGVVGPGGSRTYEVRATALRSQTPTVPLGGGNPYEGSTARISFRWRAIEGLPSTRLASLLGPLDRARPRLTLVVAPRQSVLDSGRLRVGLKCSEPCRASGAATVPLGTRPRLEMRVAGADAAARREHRLLLVFPRAVRGSLRKALQSGRTVAIVLRLQASDLTGNRATLKDSLRLRPRPEAGGN